MNILIDIDIIIFSVLLFSTVIIIIVISLYLLLFSLLSLSWLFCYSCLSLYVKLISALDNGVPTHLYALGFQNFFF